MNAESGAGATDGRGSEAPQAARQAEATAALVSTNRLGIAQ
jgi:hypothetical protein